MQTHIKRDGYLDRGFAAHSHSLTGGRCGGSVLQFAMEGAVGQMVVPVLGIVAAAAVTFYTVSFMEMRDVRFAVPSLYISV